ncbi:hypothetical protein E4U25_007250 [Claviceps purpurea]|nr:hypothetical protein E4U25_007250 [Claviceps purpurea]
MKFSTILGTFALSTLESYRAYASPLEAVSPGAQSLEERGTEYCCMLIHFDTYRQTQFVPWTGGRTRVARVAGCDIYVDQTETPPSKGGCAEWAPDTRSCFRIPPIGADVQPAEVCQGKR